MAQNPKEPLIPGLIGGFNIPKAVIENKIDVLTFLEILVRKNIITAQELDEVRAAVVAHLNAAYPELELSYTVPGGAPKAPPPAASRSIAAQSMMAPPAEPLAATSPAASASAATELPPQQPMAVEPSKPPTASEGSLLGQFVDNNAHAKPLYYSAPPPKFIK